MLWINGQISAIPTILNLFLPSFASTVVSIAVLQNQLPADAMVTPLLAFKYIYPAIYTHTTNKCPPIYAPLLMSTPSLISLLPTTSLPLTPPPFLQVAEQKESDIQALAPRGKLVFATGILGLLSVPVFKALTGLPPYLGMLAALGVMWTLTDAIHAGEGGDREELMAPAALRKIDTSGVLFFLGILLSVGALDSAG